MGEFSELQSFTNVQTRGFARHPGCSYSSQYLLSWLSSRDFYIRTPHGSLPPRAPDMLTARFGQLTVRGLAPLKIRSLVGCSMFVFSVYRLVSRRCHTISTMYPLAPASSSRAPHGAQPSQKPACRFPARASSAVDSQYGEGLHP
jgi:hypothetical protein